jgi:hypothetical protein
MDLVTVLQRLDDSEINVTITTLWDDGYDFALISYMGGGRQNHFCNTTLFRAGHIEAANAAAPAATSNYRN